MKNFKKVALSCCISALFAGCLTTKTEKPVEKKSPEKPKYVTIDVDKKTIAEVSKMCDKMLTTFYDNDYNTYSNMTLKESRATKEVFSRMSKMMSKQLGKVQEKTYLGILQKGPATVFMWRMKFEMPAQKENKKHKVDWLVKLVVGKIDGNLKVVGFFIE